MTEGQSEETTSAPEGVSVLRRNSDDVGWEYGVLVDVNNKDKVKCLEKRLFLSINVYII